MKRDKVDLWCDPPKVADLNLGFPVPSLKLTLALLFFFQADKKDIFPST